MQRRKLAEAACRSMLYSAGACTCHAPSLLTTCSDQEQHDSPDMFVGERVARAHAYYMHGTLTRCYWLHAPTMQGPQSALLPFLQQISGPPAGLK